MAAALNKRRLLTLVISERIMEKKRTPHFWVWKIYQERKEKGEFHRLVTEAKLADEKLFFQNASDDTSKVWNPFKSCFY